VLPRSHRLWLIAAGLGLLSGCANSVGHMMAELDGRLSPVELDGVPFHSQVTDQCGPAALPTVLNDSGIAVSPEELRSRVYIPGRQGALQLELLAAARQFGRVPYAIDPTMAALVAELDAGRPVLVLQNLGATLAPIWHYAVVVGYLPGEKRMVLRSGDHRRLQVKAKTFARSWRRGEFWGVVVLEPGELPTNAEADRYLRAVAAVEATVGAATAVPSYRAATRRWPENRLAWLGLGNVTYAQGELDAAASAYRRALEIDPSDAIAMNNLAQVYLESGCRDKALAVVESALEGLGTDDPVRAHLLLTRDGIMQSETTRCR